MLRRPRNWLIGSLSLALVAVILVAPPPPLAQAATTPAGALALGTGMSGRVDPRTGQFSVTAPLAHVKGLGQAEVDFDLSWDQARAGTSVDRSGWGMGWSVGTTFINPNGQKRVYPSNGGSYTIDPSQPSGLTYYKLQDLTFKQLTAAQTLRARPGATAVSYWYTIAYDDGRTDYFDINGNLAARVDRFGNRTDVRWQSPLTNVWRPTTITDSYGLVTTFGYPSKATVIISSPERSDGIQPVTTVTLSDTIAGPGTYTVQQIADPVGNQTTFGYGKSGGPASFVSSVQSATGAKTAISYQVPRYQPSLVAVQTVTVTDGNGNQLSPTQTFNLNPELPAPENNSFHNYTGNPVYHPVAGSDPLFASGDTNYTYSTGLTVGTTTTVSTYDALHRLKKRRISVAPPGKQPVLAQTHVLDYDAPVQVPRVLPANYARVNDVAHTASAISSVTGTTPSAPRTSTISTAYDDHGRVLSTVDEVGATTVNEYGPYGLVTKQTTTGVDGSVAQTVNTPIAAGSGVAGAGLAIDTSVTSVGQPGETPAARQVTGYTYDLRGQVATRTLSWAPEAKPDLGRGGGPDTIVTKYDRTVSDDGLSVTLKTTVGAGTDAAEVTNSTVDIVSGQTTSSVDALNRATSLSYDAIGREVSRTLPGNLTTTTAYTPTSTTSSGPDGRITRTTTDLLGRTIRVSDNVSNRKLTTDPTTRTLSASSYSSDGSTVTATDQKGRVSTSVVDAFGRTVSQVGATGVGRLTAYDDGAAHTRTAAIVPDDATLPQRSTTTAYDQRGRVVTSTTSFPAGGQQPGPAGAQAALPLPPDLETATQYNDLGQPEESSGNDLKLVTALTGPGGIAESSTATPTDPTAFPGAPITATTARSLSGAAVSRTLSQGDQTSEAVDYTYDAAGKIATATDPAGRETSYTYTADGQPQTKTTPSGAVTTWTYDPTSGLLATVEVTSPNAPTRTVGYLRVPAGQSGAGQVKTITDGSGTITYGYDVDGHRTSVTYPDKTSTQSSYNDLGQLVTSTDITGAVTTYGYDPTEGTLLTAVQKRGSATLASVTYGYDTLDRVRTTTRGNGIVTTNTYTADNRLALQSTTGPTSQVLESHAYTYDDHGNVATKTDSNLPGGSAAVPGGGNTWSTIYSYDAYNRLIGSATYAGVLTNGKPAGVALTQVAYGVDLGGDVTTTRTTYRTTGTRPTAKTTTTTDAIDNSGRLTTRTTGANSASQTFDADGRVLTSLNGLTNTYTADGAPATTTKTDGTTITYVRWPDGTLRSAVTKRGDGTQQLVGYHYGTDGALTNDSTADTGTASGTTTSASYLLGAGREARTLLPGATPTGAAGTTPAAQVTTGPGTGYVVRDRHSNVVGLIDSGRTVTATYGYTDYGATARADGRPATVGTVDGGRTNPFGYTGAAPRGPMTELDTARVQFPYRVYDPSTGRFTSADPVDAHNLYQGFRANPLNYSDLGGGITVFDAVMDALFAIIFVVTAIVTFGTGLLPAAAAIGAAEAADVTASVVATTVSSVLSVASNLTGAATSAALAIDDDFTLATGKGVFNQGQRNLVTAVNTGASVLAGASGLAQGATASSVEVLEDTTHAKSLTTDVNRLNNPVPQVAGPEPEPELPAGQPDQPAPADQVQLPQQQQGGNGGQVRGIQDEAGPNQADQANNPLGGQPPNQPDQVQSEIQNPQPPPQLPGVDPPPPNRGLPAAAEEQLPSAQSNVDKSDSVVVRDPITNAANETEQQVRSRTNSLNAFPEGGTGPDMVQRLGDVPITSSASAPETLVDFPNRSVLVVQQPEVPQ